MSVTLSSNTRTRPEDTLTRYFYKGRKPVRGFTVKKCSGDFGVSLRREGDTRTKKNKKKKIKSPTIPSIMLPLICLKFFKS